MGADCCGNKKTVPAPVPPPSSRTARDSCCDNSSVTSCDEYINCCTPNNEKCNGTIIPADMRPHVPRANLVRGTEECLKSVAATLCAEGVGAHAGNRNGCTSELAYHPPPGVRFTLLLIFPQVLVTAAAMSLRPPFAMPIFRWPLRSTSLS